MREFPRWIPYTYIVMVFFYLGTNMLRYTFGFDPSLEGLVIFWNVIFHSLLPAAATMIIVLLFYFIYWLLAKLFFIDKTKYDDCDFVQVIDQNHERQK